MGGGGLTTIRGVRVTTHDAKKKKSMNLKTMWRGNGEGSERRRGRKKY